MNEIRDNIKKVLKEGGSVSKPARDWAEIVYYLLGNLDDNENRLIIEGSDYPEQYKEFPIDYIIVDFNDYTNGYVDENSGTDKDGNYVVHIMVLNRFRNNSYMQTILNHEFHHAIEDHYRQKGGHPGISHSKESKEMYTDDFVKVVKERINVGKFFKDIMTYYYLLSNLELNAFMENIYDRDVINDYKKMITKLRDYNAFKVIYEDDIRDLDKNWKILHSANIPFLKKYKDYTTFLRASNKYFNKRSEEILRKINKVEYLHRNN